ncbi:UNKNOWN [Stylonychia lemnae]|uniref:Uncharacterized protein n=1 Tax=Stylonychia lemnae TaxID=5949 RepID=A0A078ACC9_STYLE|nr:UNKNOWN [Stylonychia lemnae]|eukprot:CDW79910.1 UNKNOWN [Stylonychia lemnae]
MQTLDLMRRMSIMHTIESTFEKFIDEKRNNSVLIEEDMYAKEKEKEKEKERERESLRKKSSNSKLFFDVPKSNGSLMRYNTRRNDLKFKTMAQYKAVLNGDILTFDLIGQGLMRRPSIRALALENSSIEEFERGLEENQSDFDEEQQQYNNKNQRPASAGRNKDDDERSMIRSSREFWEEINTKDSKYKNAIIIKGYKTENNQSQNHQGNRKLLRDYDQEERNFVLEERRKRSTFVSHHTNREEFQSKIEKIQRAHEIELKNTKTLAKNYAVEYFKTKALELTQIFTNESYNVIEKYEELKEKMLHKDSKITQLNSVITRQEKIISELRNYIKENISKFVMKIEANKKELNKELTKRLSNLKIARDDETRYQYRAQKNVFDLYNSYVELVKPQKKIKKYERLENENASLWERVQSLQTEIAAIQNICDIYFQEEQSFKHRIEKLEQERYENLLEIQNLKQDMNSKSRQQQDRYSKDIEYLKVKYDQLREIVDIETKVSQAIARAATDRLAVVQRRLDETKMVMRTPRLYRIYRQKMEQTQIPLSEHYQSKHYESEVLVRLNEQALKMQHKNSQDNNNIQQNLSFDDHSYNRRKLSINLNQNSYLNQHMYLNTSTENAIYNAQGGGQTTFHTRNLSTQNTSQIQDISKMINLTRDGTPSAVFKRRNHSLQQNQTLNFHRPNTTASNPKRRNIGGLNYTIDHPYPMSNKMQAFQNMFVNHNNSTQYQDSLL